MVNKSDQEKALEALNNGSKSIHDAIEASLHQALSNHARDNFPDLPDVLCSVVGPKAEMVMDVAVTLYTLFYAPYTYAHLQMQVDAMANIRDFSYVIRHLGGQKINMGEPIKTPRNFPQAFVVELVREASKKPNPNGGHIKYSHSMVERSLQFLSYVKLIARSDRAGGQGLDMIVTKKFKALCEQAIMDAASEEQKSRLFPFSTGVTLSTPVVIGFLIFAFVSMSGNSEPGLNQYEEASVHQTSQGLQHLFGGGKPNNQSL